MKCFICKKEINKEDAYMEMYNSPNGKVYKRYYCNEEEYKKNRLTRRNTLFSLDAILGYPCTNNYRNKRLKQLIDKYEEEKVYMVIEENKEKLKYLLSKKEMDEIYMINYIMKSLESILNNQNSNK